MLKLIALISKRPGISDEEFYRYWLDKHASFALKIVPGIKKYTQNHMVRTPGSKPGVDGITEMWFEDLAAYNKYLAWRQTTEGKALLKDEDNFLDRSKTVRYSVEEHVIVP